MLVLTEKKCSKCKRILPAAMFNKANWLASGLRPDCKECYRAFKKQWWAQQPKGPAASAKREQAELKQRGLRRCKVCEEVKAASAETFAYADRSTGRLDTTCRVCAARRTSEWAKANRSRAKLNAYVGCARRYATKRSRTPRWLSDADRAAIKSIYAECRRLSVETGIKHHVDHEVPLVGKAVSGLHVPWNLQILRATENVRKSAKWSY